MPLLRHERYLESRHHERYKLISDLRPYIWRGNLIIHNGEVYSYDYACSEDCMIVDSQDVRINPIRILKINMEVMLN